MHSPESTQELAHWREASGPSPVRTMSSTPAIVACGSASAMPAASVIGQASKHFPHFVQASSISSTREARAVSKVWSTGHLAWRFLASIIETWIAKETCARRKGPTMKRSTDKILTTHVGSLIRPPALQEFLRAKQSGKPFDERAYDKCLTDSVAGIVRRQAEAGIDVVSDGEFGKAISWSQ